MNDPVRFVKKNRAQENPHGSPVPGFSFIEFRRCAIKLQQKKQLRWKQPQKKRPQKKQPRWMQPQKKNRSPLQQQKKRPHRPQQQQKCW